MSTHALDNALTIDNRAQSTILKACAILRLLRFHGVVAFGAILRIAFNRLHFELHLVGLVSITSYPFDLLLRLVSLREGAGIGIFVLTVAIRNGDL